MKAISFVRSPRKIFVDAKNISARQFFSKTKSGRRDRFRPKIVQIGAILAIFELFKVRKFRMPFFDEFGRSSQDLGESDYDSPKSWDDWLNSPKSGMCIIGDWNTRKLVLATQGMSCFEHKDCLVSNTRNVLFGTQGMPCFKHKECSASNTRNVLRGAQGMFCLEHKECSVSNTRSVLLRTLGMFCFEH